MNNITEIFDNARAAVIEYEELTGTVAQTCDTARAFWFDRWCFITGSAVDRYRFDCLDAYRRFQERHQRDMTDLAEKIKQRISHNGSK